MLLLARRLGEKIRIGDHICVQVISISGNQIRLGIDAPREVSVHREEIYQRIVASQERRNKERPPAKTKALSYILARNESTTTEMPSFKNS